MFFFQRILSLIIFTIVLLFTYLLIRRAKSEKSIKKILIFYLIMLGIMGYFYVPYITADLYTIKEHIVNVYSNKSFKDICLQMKNSRMPIQILYYWFFTQIGNLNLLPCITAIITYFNVFYILYKTLRKFKWDNIVTASVLIFFMCAGQYIEVISGIRCMLAYSIVALAIFLDYFEEKGFSKTFFLYFLGIFIHDSAYPLLGIRILMMIFQKENGEKNAKLYKVINIFAFLSILAVAGFYFKDKIVEVVEHAYYYFTGGIYFYVWEYIIAFLCMLLCINYLKFYKKISSKYNLSRISTNYLTFVKLIIIVTMIFFFEYSIFQRYRTFVMILMLPIVGELLWILRLKDKKLLSYVYKNFITMILFIYFIACARGNLCNLKFFA